MREFSGEMEQLRPQDKSPLLDLSTKCISATKNSINVAKTAQSASFFMSSLHNLYSGEVTLWLMEIYRDADSPNRRQRKQRSKILDNNKRMCLTLEGLHPRCLHLRCCVTSLYLLGDRKDGDDA